MCTLIAFHAVWEEAPLVLAVNRDEVYDRPASPPAAVGWRPSILMPRDERAGGTWMGASSSGLWVGLTNRRGDREDEDRRSRGLLCLELLNEPTPDAVVAKVESLERPYNPFNLVVADAGSLVLVEYADDRAMARRLGPGCHLVTNQPFDETSAEPKAIRALKRLKEEGLRPERTGQGAPEGLEERLTTILGDHGVMGRDALCLHGGSYGTRSAAVWRIVTGAGGRPVGMNLLYADGPACSAPFERFRLAFTS